MSEAMHGPDDSKLARACDMCRKRKVKCSGPQDGMSSCVNCQKHGVRCTYNEGTRKRGPPRGYVEELEKRLASLEQQLKRQGTSSPNQSTSDSSPPNDRDTPSRRESRSVADATADDEDLLEMMRHMNTNGHYHGRSSVTSLVLSVDTFRERCTGKRMDTLRLLQQAAPSFIERVFESETVKELHNHPLPEQDLIDSLVDHYFTKVNVLMPILHRPSFERHLTAGLANTSSGFRSLVFAVLASGARYSEGPRTLHRYPWLKHPISDTPEAEARGYSFVFAAIRLGFTMAPTSLYILQSLTLLCEYILQAGSVLVGWTVIGWTARMMVTSGAHCLYNPGWSTSLLQDQLRKRAFWYFYCLDRKTSLWMGRPFALPDDIIDVDLPLDIDDATLDYYDRLSPPHQLPNLKITRHGNLATLQQLSQLSRLYERIVEVLYSSHPSRNAKSEITALDSVLHQWLEQLPESLRWNPADPDDCALSRSAAVLCAFYSALMTVHRAALWPQCQSDVDRCLSVAKEAALNISHIVEVLRQRGIAHANWVYPLTAVIQAGVLLILTCYAGDTVTPMTEADDASFKRLLAFLRDLGGSSNSAAVRCVISLETQLALVKEDCASNAAVTRGALPASLETNLFTANVLPATLAPSVVSDGISASVGPNNEFGASAAAPDIFDAFRAGSSEWLGSSDWFSQMGFDGSWPSAVQPPF